MSASKGGWATKADALRSTRRAKAEVARRGGELLSDGKIRLADPPVETQLRRTLAEWNDQGYNSGELGKSVTQDLRAGKYQRALATMRTSMKTDKLSLPPRGFVPDGKVKGVWVRYVDGQAVEFWRAGKLMTPEEYAKDHNGEFSAGARVTPSVNKSVAADIMKGDKPPAGFTPIPGSKKGGYHKKTATGYQTWYPGLPTHAPVKGSVGGDGTAVLKHPDWKSSSYEVKKGDGGYSVTLNHGAIKDDHETAGSMGEALDMVHGHIIGTRGKSLLTVSVGGLRQSKSHRRLAEDKVQKSVNDGDRDKPPAGFTPIPGSKKGGYHKRTGQGYQTWYPGMGVQSFKTKIVEKNGLRSVYEHESTGLTSTSHKTSGGVYNHHSAGGFHDSHGEAMDALHDAIKKKASGGGSKVQKSVSDGAEYTPRRHSREELPAAVRAAEKAAKPHKGTPEVDRVVAHMQTVMRGGNAKRNLSPSEWVDAVSKAINRTHAVVAAQGSKVQKSVNDGRDTIIKGADYAAVDQAWFDAVVRREAREIARWGGDGGTDEAASRSASDRLIANYVAASDGAATRAERCIAKDGPDCFYTAILAELPNQRAIHEAEKAARAVGRTDDGLVTYKQVMHVNGGGPLL